MATLTRSKDEVARIVALLESDEYDNAEQLAYAVLKEATEVIAARGMWVVRPSNAPVWWGPYWTVTQAQKAWETQIGPLAGAGGRGEVGWVSPWPETPPPQEESGMRERCACGHIRAYHTNVGKRPYCGNRKDGCKCAGFTKAG